MNGYWWIAQKRAIPLTGNDEANMVLKKIAEVWDNKILPKYDARFNLMKTKDKVKLFEDTKVFE
jgi:hypothetical protein